MFCLGGGGGASAHTKLVICVRRVQNHIWFAWQGATSDPSLLDDPMRAVEQLQQDPATTAAFLQNPLFAQMGQMLLSNPAALQQAERVMSGREEAQRPAEVTISPKCAACAVKVDCAALHSIEHVRLVVNTKVCSFLVCRLR